MALYKVIHGSFKATTAPKSVNGFVGPLVRDDDGNVCDLIELTDKEVKLMDPTGTCLKLKSEVDLEMAGEKAKAEAIEKAKAEAKKGGKQ